MGWVSTNPDAKGIRIKHKTKKSGIALIPINDKPMLGDSVYPCNNCKVIHTDSYGNPVKTVHLWLDDQGMCIVSEGVYKDMKRNGHFDGLLPVLILKNSVVNPPTITLKGNRFEVDQKNSRIQEWRKEPVT